MQSWSHDRFVLAAHPDEAQIGGVGMRVREVRLERLGLNNFGKGSL